MRSNNNTNEVYIGDQPIDLDASVYIISQNDYLKEKQPEKREIKKKRVKSKQIIREKPNKLFKIKEIKKIEEMAFKLDANAKEWAKKMELGGLKIIFSMLSKLKAHKIPIKDGSHGITLREDNIYLSDIYPFIFNFMKEERVNYWWQTTTYQYPNTGKKYLHIVWKIDSLEELINNLLCTFENLKISTSVLWFQHPFQPRMIKRFDDPEKNKEISFMYKEDRNEATEGLRNFNMENFENETSVTKQVKMVVGDTPTNRKRPCYFTISFTRNWEIFEDSFVGGSFQFRYFHEVFESGMLKGYHASGDLEAQQLEKVSDVEAQNILNGDLGEDVEAQSILSEEN